MNTTTELGTELSMEMKISMETKRGMETKTGIEMTTESMTIEAQIEKTWEKLSINYPLLRQEWDGFWEKAAEKEKESEGENRLWLKAIYASTSVHDWISYPLSEMYTYVQASRKMVEEIAYAKQVPKKYFYAYVLPARVNNEYLDGSRMWLYEQLRDRVMGKSMAEAALEVNLWCYERATYTPADDRTISPFGICKRAKGRCGEESVFLVSALRAVGIPARQCYAPRWAHCDDNHAWVEVWTDGEWHYMGACEPEAVLDKGWFTAAASKALLIRTREPNFGENLSGYELVNCTSRYGQTTCLQVQVLSGGTPKENALVQFQLVNYSELFSLYEERTNADGMAYMEAGTGDMYVTACLDGVWVGKSVDLRTTQTLTLELEEGIAPKSLCQSESQEKENEQNKSEIFDLIPPKETIGSLKSENSTETEYFIETEDSTEAEQKSFILKNYPERFKESERIREEYEAQFAKSGAKWFVGACGNQEEIRAFLAEENTTMKAGIKEKEMLLEVLREKDYVDITKTRLVSYLSSSLVWKEKYPEEIWQEGILNPRVENEMILEIREEIVSLLRRDAEFGKNEENEEKGKNGENDASVVLSADMILAWMKKKIQTAPEFGLQDRSVNYAGCIRHRVCPESKWQALLVQICRAMGIASRLHPVTSQAEAWNPETERWEHIQAEGQKEPEHQLTLVCHEEDSVSYGEQITISRWNGETYDTLDYHGKDFRGTMVLSLREGSYRILTTRRQIDGSVSIWMQHFGLTEDTRLEVIVREDQMRQKLKSEELPRLYGRKMEETSEVNGKKQVEKEAVQIETKSKKGMLLVYAEPGKEPTEHLFQELLELKGEWNQKGYPIHIILSAEEEQKNATLQKVLKELPNSRIWIAEKENVGVHKEQRQKLLECMGVGDERLPFSMAVGADGTGKFAFANYNIRTAHTLLRILNVSASDACHEV